MQTVTIAVHYPCNLLTSLASALPQIRRWFYVATILRVEPLLMGPRCLAIVAGVVALAPLHVRQWGDERS